MLPRRQLRQDEMLATLAAALPQKRTKLGWRDGFSITEASWPSDAKKTGTLKGKAGARGW
jgi:hypothetical protein